MIELHEIWIVPFFDKDIFSVVASGKDVVIEARK